jgi:hypothetical protein
MRGMHLLTIGDGHAFPMVYRLVHRKGGPPAVLSLSCWVRSVPCCAACAAIGLDSSGKRDVLFCKAGPRRIDLGALDGDQENQDIIDTLRWVEDLGE